MKKTICGIFTIAFINLIAISQYVSACAWDEEKSTFIFGPDLLSDTTYKMYYFRTPLCDGCEKGLYQANLLEWQKKFPEVKNTTDIERVIYKSSLAEMEQLVSGSNPFGDNTFAAALSKNKDFAQYLLNAKKSEQYTSVEWDYDWEGRSQSDLAGMQVLMENFTAALDATTDPFLKQRYAFQLIRLAHYSGKFADCVAYYEKYVTADMPQNSVYYRTLALKAGATRFNNDPVTAKYIFATIFDKSPELRYMAYKNFKYIDVDEEQWKNCLNLASTNTEKSSMWLIKNVYDNGIDINLLRNLYESDPGSPRLEVAVLKQLNNIEESIYLPYLTKSAVLDSTQLTYGTEDTWEATTKVVQEEASWWSRFWTSIANFFRRLFGMEEKTSTPSGEVAVRNTRVLLAQVGEETSEESGDIAESQTIREFKELIDKISDDKKTSSQALYLLSKSYLNIMTSDLADAQKALDKAKEINGEKNPAITKQAAYLDVLIEVLISSSIQAPTETKVLAYVKSTENSKDEFDIYRRNFVLTELGRKYLGSGEYNKAVITFINSGQDNVGKSLIDIYFNNADMESLKTYAASVGTLSDIEKYLMKNFYTADQLIEIQATKLLRIGKFKEASELFGKLSEAYWKKNKHEGYAYFTGGTFDCGNFTTSFIDPADKPQTAEMSVYNKKAFTEKVLELQSKNTAESYMQLGNGFYYTPFWCYNSPLWNCGDLLEALNQVDPTSYPLNVGGFPNAYHNRKMSFMMQYCTQYFSVKNYEKAAELSQDPENKARALFCAKIAVDKHYVSYWYPDNTTSLNHFDILTRELSTTKYYQSAAGTCAGLRDFQSASQ